MSKKVAIALGCNYQGFEFGGSYLDSVCIDGYLWDADSFDGRDALTNGGEIPCPQCNHAAWLEHGREDVVERGYEDAEAGVRANANPYTTAKLKYEADRKILNKWWAQGHAEYQASIKGVL